MMGLDQYGGLYVSLPRFPGAVHTM
jgi:hypothetical protein